MQHILLARHFLVDVIAIRKENPQAKEQADLEVQVEEYNINFL